MKITSVSVVMSRKRTVNYQSNGNSVGLAADLEEGRMPAPQCKPFSGKRRDC